jgi:hypothetical protein
VTQASASSPGETPSTRAAQPQDGAVVNHHQMLALLRESIYPEQREWAAENMSSFDWHLSPEIAEGLMTTAQKDTVVAVRTACIRCMVRMEINTPQVRNVLETLKTEKEPQIQKEAKKALAKLASHP